MNSDSRTHFKWVQRLFLLYFDFAFSFSLIFFNGFIPLYAVVVSCNFWFLARFTYHIFASYMSNRFSRHLCCSRHKYYLVSVSAFVLKLKNYPFRNLFIPFPYKFNVESRYFFFKYHMKCIILRTTYSTDLIWLNFVCEANIARLRLVDTPLTPPPS